MGVNDTLPVLERLIHGVNRFLRSFKHFFKSSFLSLVVIAIILVLLTQMSQAFTMMVALIESSKWSLFLSIYFINALALVLSHYPIYTYYASDLNNSGDYTAWHKKTPLRFWPFRKYCIYVFTTKPETGYVPDTWANYLRYAIGLLIHGVWIHFIISSFMPNIRYENFPIATVTGITYLLLFLPFVLYIYLKRRFKKLTTTVSIAGHPLQKFKLQERTFAYKKLLRKLGVCYVLTASVCLLLLGLLLSPVGNFSPGGLVLLLIANYALMFNYVFFRLLRTKISEVHTALGGKKRLPLFNLVIGWLQPLEISENYLLLYHFNFLIGGILIIWSTLASIFEGNLLNGIPILLAFFYCYYFIIASLGKYFFVSKKLNLFKTRRYRGLFLTGVVLFFLLLISNVVPLEVTTHEIDLVENTRSEIPEAVFIDSLQQKQDNTLFFIASHGGGLKANVWTLYILNTLQRETDGQLLQQTIAFSGASGGSLGLALYTGLYKEHGTNFDAIEAKINDLADENYTSLDLTLTFGIDSYRKLWPFSNRIGLRDRPYYAMRKYQNKIEATPNKKLSQVSFRDYWKSAFSRDGYFPSLIMNTAGTAGNRGILWSVKQENFQAIFPNAVNLADLTGDTTLPFYQAVSTTNRFPIFSPAAKIKGYGHYIDAGAIDNSGLLGCLDLHNYLIRDEKVLGNKQIAYIEIINSKSLYVAHLIGEFMEKQNLSHINTNEHETDNLVADIKTGLNLDKIPNYLSQYLKNWEETSDGKIKYFKLLMPHKVNLSDVETYFNGAIVAPTIVQNLSLFLDHKNKEILEITEKASTSFFEPWMYYEPTLSRHLSWSSLNYIDAILLHPYLQSQYAEIKKIIFTKKVTAQSLIPAGE